MQSPAQLLPPAEMGTAQQEFPVDNAKVYVVMRGLANDYGNIETWVNSVHTTREAADTVCQAKRLEQLEDQLESIRAQPSYVPELRYEWYVNGHVLES